MKYLCKVKNKVTKKSAGIRCCIMSTMQKLQLARKHKTKVTLTNTKRNLQDYNRSVILEP